MISVIVFILCLICKHAKLRKQVTGLPNQQFKTKMKSVKALYINLHVQVSWNGGQYVC